LFHLVFGSHIGRALGADSGEKSGLASDIDTATVESLNALDPKRPIREAVSELLSRFGVGLSDATSDIAPRALDRTFIPSELRNQQRRLSV
jgi:hypothetical protein